MRTLNNTGDPLVDGSNNPLADVAVTFTLVDANGKRKSGWAAATGERVVGTVKTTTNASGEFSVSLWENDKHTEVTQWLCHIDYLGAADFQASVATSASVLKWIDFFAAGAVLVAATVANIFNQATATTTGLTYGFYGGMVRSDSTSTLVADGTVALAASTTNYVEVSGAGTVTANASGFTAGRFPMATVLTGASTITTVTDKRGFAYVQPAGGSGDMILASVQTNTAAKTFNDGTLKLAGSTSGASTLKAPAIAAGYIHTLQARAGTLSDDTDLALKAPLVSPALTGTPTSPTAAALTNTTQIATTAFVRTEVANLVASAPAALDTLNELSAALGNDANFATTMTNALAAKSALSGATFTGLVNLAAGANIASATAVDLTAATGNTVVITGVEPSTSLIMNAGQQMTLLPSGAWPLTFHPTTMNLEGGVDHVCAAGHRLSAVKDGAGVIRVNITKQDGTAVVSSGGGVTSGEIQAQTHVAFTTGGTLTAYTLTPSPAIASYIAGQSFFIKFHAASGADPTLAISGIGTPPNLVAQRYDGSYANIKAGEIPINNISRVTLISSSQALVERVIVKSNAKRTSNVSGNFPVNSWAVVPYADSEHDTLAEMSSTSRFTASSKGIYTVSAAASTGLVSWVAGNNIRIGAWKNGAESAQGSRYTAEAAHSSARTLVLVADILLDAGQYIEINILSSVSGVTLADGSPMTNYFSVSAK